MLTTIDDFQRFLSGCKFPSEWKKTNKNHKQCKNPAGSYLFKVNNRNNRARCEISSGAFIVNFEHISHLVLVFLLLTLSK